MAGEGSRENNKHSRYQRADIRYGGRGAATRKILGCTVLAALVVLAAGCANTARTRPEHGPDEPFIRFDVSKIVSEWTVPHSYVEEPGTKLRFLYLGPQGQIVGDSEPGANRWGLVVSRERVITVEELERLFEKGGRGTYSVFLIVNRPGKPGLQIASDQFRLPR